MSDVELRPCPFCGSDQVEEARVPSVGAGYTYSYWCRTCHACGPDPEHEDKAEARKGALQLWNLRADEVAVAAIGKAHAETLAAMSNELSDVRSALQVAERERDNLRELINSPQTSGFLEAVRTEAAHQVERWGSEHDVGKSDSDWFWLLGYLAGKAIRPDQSPEKVLHHIITTAAVCLNWHKQKTGADMRMRPGIDPEKAGGL